MRVVAPLAAAVLLGLSVSSFAANDSSFRLGGATVLPPPNLEKFVAEDAKSVGGPYRYGVQIAVSGMRLGEKGFGQWAKAGKNQWVWRWEVISPAAKSLDFHFSRLKLPASATLAIRGEGQDNYRVIDYTQVAGEAFSSPYVKGERAVLELTVDAADRAKVELELASVTHGYRGLFDAEMFKSGSCNVDTICPAGDGWRDQIDSVGHYTFSKGGSSYVCTGTLIANAANTTTPYFLTANHCVSTQTVVGTMVVYWNYQSSTCRTPGSTSSGTPLSRSIATHSQSGATLRATNSASDFALVELSTAVPTDANPYWSGWDRSGSTPTSAVGIHHPQGHEKRIAVENQALSISAYGGGSGTTHWRVMDWDEGTTEGGSSGSGLWNQNKLLVGQLHGGSAACGNDLSDYYGRLSVSWTGGGTSSTRLSNWLDPNNSGVNSIAGYRAGGSTDTTAPTVPSGITASAASSSAINLSWTASSDTGGSGLSGYKIERCTGASCTDFAQVGTTASTSFADSGLAAATTYRYRVRAYDGAGNHSGYSSIASATTQTTGGTVLSNGVTVSNLSASTGNSLNFTMDVPAGASNLNFAMSGGTGDADMYVKFGSAPTDTSYDCRPYKSGNSETCSFATPQAGTYYVRLKAYSSFSGVSLTGSYSTGQQSLFENTADYTISDNSTVESPIAVNRTGNAPSGLKVNVRIIHTYIGDLKVDLIAPDGSVYNLHNRTGSGTDNIITTYTVNASSELANGTWKLRVNDNAGGDTGYIDSWSLQF
ncbi:MAG TPA: proprotein convertase P-domain-containing protein [Vicinamibacterales bacterium]|nr:proprotein convertase P-domain-containing protein [Vicinamibacterales bacterium]